MILNAIMSIMFTVNHMLLITSDGTINQNRIGIIGISGVFQSFENQHWSCIIQTRFRYQNDSLNIQGIR